MGMHLWAGLVAQIGAWQSIGQAWPVIEKVLLVLGGAVGLWTLRLSYLQSRSEAIRDARQHVVEFSKFDRPGLKDADNAVYSRFKGLGEVPRGDGLVDYEPISLDVIREKFRENAGTRGGDGEPASRGGTAVLAARPSVGVGLQEQLDTVLSYLEHLSHLVYSRTLDEDMAFEKYGRSVVRDGIRFGEYIRAEQQGNPRLWEYVPHLAARWKVRLEKSMRASKPFFVRDMERREWNSRLASWVARLGVLAGVAAAAGIAVLALSR